MGKFIHQGEVTLGPEGDDQWLQDCSLLASHYQHTQGVNCGSNHV